MVASRDDAHAGLGNQSANIQLCCLQLKCCLSALPAPAADVVKLRLHTPNSTLPTPHSQLHTPNSTLPNSIQKQTAAPGPVKLLI